MRLFGLFDITRAKAAGPPQGQIVDGNRGNWWPRIMEAFAGAFQRDIEWTNETVLCHNAVYTCISLIASDVGKLRPKLVEQDSNGIWNEVTEKSPFLPVLKKPNHYQNYIQFKEWWITSKLLHGNTYVLKERDNRGGKEKGIVVGLYILDPCRVTVLVAPNGEIFYKLKTDNLSGLEESLTVPASEIIHDRMNCLFHPLVGVSPIYASGTAANVGLKIAKNSAKFFAHGSNPSGVLTAPKEITEADAKRLSEAWETNFTGDQSGRVAVLGNDLKFEPMRMTAVDSQLIQHLKWTSDVVCSTFHVPPFKVSLGAVPAYQNPEIMNQIYYSDCLQAHIESMELALDEGLELTEVPGKTMGVELEIETLLRMDVATQYKTLGEGIGGSLLTPNEARRKIDLRPLKGGDTIYMQQQNYSLQALDARDRANPAPSTTPAPATPTPPSPTAPPSKDFDTDLLAAKFTAALWSKAA